MLSTFSMIVDIVATPAKSRKPADRDGLVLQDRRCIFYPRASRKAAADSFYYRPEALPLAAWSTELD